MCSAADILTFHDLLLICVQYSLRGCGRAVLSMFTSMPKQPYDKLNGNEIHRPENIITLEMSIHAEFDDLCIWFMYVSGSYHAH
jgi:hypothetical protein